MDTEMDNVNDQITAIEQGGNIAIEQNEFNNINGNDNLYSHNNNNYWPSDEESDEAAPFAYEALPQDENEINEDEDDENDYYKNSNETQIPTGNTQLLSSSSQTITTSTTFPPPPILTIQASKIEMIQTNDLSIINDVMQNIRIPESAVPEWARSIPEESWLPRVIVVDDGNENIENSSL
ncbi:9031_t:CDS:2 [Ambispora gerdemannii]|uniref:9031_t:CDS:1 n=1 Tax=Ambispora gerdemannii TaxID=144530 RepID=A0A9N8W4Q0_9GLOM|nr:9031_t:CDS:2 [Ambispora gerdemannii]